MRPILLLTVIPAFCSRLGLSAAERASSGRLSKLRSRTISRGAQENETAPTTMDDPPMGDGLVVIEAETNSTDELTSNATIDDPLMEDGLALSELETNSTNQLASNTADQMAYVTTNAATTATEAPTVAIFPSASPSPTRREPSANRTRGPSPSPDAAFESSAAASTPTASPRETAPEPTCSALPVGPVNVLVLTDVHSRVSGGRGSLDADYGDVLSFHRRLRDRIRSAELPDGTAPDLWFVNNGDFVRGTVVGGDPPIYLSGIEERMPYDAVAFGDCDVASLDTVGEWRKPGGLVDVWGERLVTSNIRVRDGASVEGESDELGDNRESNNGNSTGSVPLGSNYRFLHGNQGTILVLGFLGDARGEAAIPVETVEDVVKQSWFASLFASPRPTEFDAILVMAHMDGDDESIALLYNTLRDLVGESMVILFVAGHTHVRSYVDLDDYASSFEAGRHLDTIGFVSFDPKRGSFQHAFVDANKASIAQSLGMDKDEYPTQDGKDLSAYIERTFEHAGANEVLGCSPLRYKADGYLNETDSLLRLYLEEVMPISFLSKYNTGSYSHLDNVFIQRLDQFVEYDLFPGTVTVNDIVGIVPADYQITPVSHAITGKDILEIIAAWSNNELILDNTTNVVGLSLPNSARTQNPRDAIDNNTKYALYTLSHFALSLDKIMNEINVGPISLSSHPAYNGDKTMRSMWVDYIKSSWPYDGNNCECIKDDSCGNSTDSSLGSTGTWPWEKPSSTSSSTGTHGSTHVSSPNNPNPPASESSESRHQTSGNHSSRAKLWDLYLLQPIGEIPNEDSGAGGRAAVPTTGSNNNLYGGGLGSSQLKRYDVQWAPTRRGVVSTCSFDRKVQIHSVAGLATKCGRPPKWMRPSSGVSCGFGGVLVSINIPQKYVKIHSVVEHPQLVEASRQLEMEFDPDDCISYCRAIAERANDEHESLGSGVCFRSALELDHFRRNGEVLVPRLSLVEVWRLFGRDPEQHPVVVAAFSIVVGLGKAQGDEAGGRSKIPLAPIVLVLYIILQFSSAVEQPTISDSPVSLLPSPLSQNFVGAVATSISSLALGYSSRRFWFVPSWLRIHGPLHHCMSVWVCSHGLPSTTVNSTLWFGISSFLAKCWAALYSYNTSFAWKNGSMYLLQKWCLQCWWSLGFCGFIAITACGCVPSITVYIRLLWRTTSCCACMATHLLLISLPCGVLRLFSVVWFCDYFDARKWWKCLRSYVDATLASIPWSACMQRVSLSPMDIVFGVLWVVGSVTIWLLHQCLALLPHHQLRIRQLTFMQFPSSSLILSRRCHTRLISPPCLLWSLMQSRLILSRPLLDDPCRLQQSLLHQRETCCELVKNIWLRVYGVGIFATMPLFWLKNIDDGLAFLLQWLVLVHLMLHFPMLVWQHTNTTTTDLLVQPAFTSTMFFPDMWSYLWLTATFLFRVVISINLVLMRVPPWCDICQFLSAHVFCVSKDYALWVSLPSSQNMMHRIGVYWLITGLLPTFTSILWRYTSSRSRHFPVLALLRVLASHDLLLQMMITHQHRPITSCPCQLSLLRQIEIVINSFLRSTSPEGVIIQTPEGVVTRVSEGAISNVNVPHHSVVWSFTQNTVAPTDIDFRMIICIGYLFLADSKNRFFRHAMTFIAVMLCNPYALLPAILWALYFGILMLQPFQVFGFPWTFLLMLFFVFGAINAMVLNVPFYHNIGSRGSVGHTEKHSHVYLTSMYSTITLWQYQTKSNTKMKCYLAMIAKEFGFYNQYLSSAC